MRTYQRHGITYRELEPDERIKRTDLVAHGDPDTDEFWSPPSLSTTMLVKDALYDWENLHWLRPYDPLIYAMEKAKYLADHPGISESTKTAGETKQ